MLRYRTVDFQRNVVYVGIRFKLKDFLVDCRCQITYFRTCVRTGTYEKVSSIFKKLLGDVCMYVRTITLGNKGPKTILEYGTVRYRTVRV